MIDRYPAGLELDIMDCLVVAWARDLNGNTAQLLAEKGCLKKYYKSYLDVLLLYIDWKNIKDKLRTI